MLKRIAHALRTLLGDVRGNALMITAFAIFPLMAMIGSAYDISRGYTAQTRLQQACDAGALAGRRAMTGDIFTDAVKAEAIKFFNFNFPQSTYQTAAFTPTVTKPERGVIRVQATTTQNTAIMRLFGISTVPLGVDCTASQDYVNTDIVLVLDTTGSMAEKPDGDSCNSTCQKNGGSKIAGLQRAVLALYDELKPTQDQLTAAGMRLRYGVVPYSSTVNVGALLDANAVRNPANYMQYRCSLLSILGACIGQWGWYSTEVNHSANWFSTWRSASRPDLGCIEERKTTVISGTATSAPSDAYDLDIDLVPNTSADTKWIPYDPAARTNSQGNAPDSYCPYPATRLKERTRAELQTYVGNLTPVGGTYHDIGLLWGARMISARGVFADSPALYQGMPVNRFVIFMTDGDLTAYNDVYTAYGIEQYDRRVSGVSNSSNANLTARHVARSKIICDRIKTKPESDGQPTKIIVVAFGTGLTPVLQACASDGMAEVASNNTELTDLFRDIGKKIGALRLTK